MLTQEEFAALKPGDQVRICGMVNDYAQYNGKIHTFVEITLNIFKKPVLKVTPTVGNSSRVHPDFVELIGVAECTCSSREIFDRGCKCGFWAAEQQNPAD